MFVLPCLMILVLVFVVYRARQGAGRGGAIALLMRPKIAEIANDDSVNLDARTIRRWEWVASPRQPTCRLTGQVQVVSGGNLDVEVFVLTAANYDSLSHGRSALAYLQTDRTNGVSLDVTTTTPGRLVLAISNRFSPQAGKVLQLRRVRVVCQ